MYHIDNSEQIKSKITNTFKVKKHIEAGEYEVGSDSKTISIKNGQYIVWNYNSLQISKKQVKKWLKRTLLLKLWRWFWF